MEKNCRIDFFTLWKRTTTLLLCGIIIVIISGCCPKKYTNETMQPLAATASDLARAVMRFAKENPSEAASLDDRELVRRATAYDPDLLKPYDGLVVRGTADGVILVCSGDGERGLLEDAECTDIVDNLMWSDINAPCQFTLKPEIVCP
ncbi:MAG: hypothetical protein WA081_01795 [Desulfosalsimonadaceae bacterium]